MWLIVAGAVVGLYFLRKFIKGGQCSSNARLDGKTVVITGCNTGIGKETAVDMCNRGARVIMACRSEERMRSAAEEVKARTGAGEDSVALYKLDLSDLQSVRDCAKEILDKEDRIDILINNAGVMMCPFTKTKDGLEMQMGTNHFGHFLFTNLLLDKIKASAPARIVTLSSKAHMDFTTNMVLEDLNYEHKAYSRTQAYGQSKLANILFTRELARRLKGTGVTCYALHPGVVMTELSRHVEDLFGPAKILFNTIFLPITTYVLKTAKDGAQTSIYCAVDPTLNDETGKYYADCAEIQPTRYAQDDVMAKKLWDLSEKVVGL